MDEIFTPKVSVLLASYNQAEYLDQAIESVLSQSFSNFELLISDDASTDCSREIIKKYNDPRIRTHFFEVNQGSVLNTRYLCGQAQGEYIAFIGSDDLWMSKKLERQVACMDSNHNIGACFTWANTVDENGDILTKKEVNYSEIFLQPNRSRGKWLRKFFYEGNCLAHPSAMIRRCAYLSIAPHSVALRQIPDFDFWIRLAKKYDIWVVDEVLAQNRMLIKNAKNMSAVTNTTIIRNMNECMLTIGTFFDGLEDGIFVDGFHDLFQKKEGPWTSAELECEKAFLLCKGNYLKLAAQIEGFLRLKTLLDDDSTRKVLQGTYHFDDTAFFELTGSEGLGSYIFANENMKEANQAESKASKFRQVISKMIGRSL